MEGLPILGSQRDALVELVHSVMRLAEVDLNVCKVGYDELR